LPALAAGAAESAPLPLAATHGAPPERLPAATRFDLREPPERRPAPKWRERRSAQALPGRRVETGPPAPGQVTAPRALVRCAAMEWGSAPLERPVPVRYAAGSE